VGDDGGQGERTLPPEIGNMPRLRVLALKGNNIYGTIPSSYATERIQQVDLQDNSGLVGYVPEFPKIK